MKGLLLVAVVIVLSACGSRSPVFTDDSDHDGLSVVHDDDELASPDGDSAPSEEEKDELTEIDEEQDEYSDTDALLFDEDAHVPDQDDAISDGYITKKCKVQSAVFDQAKPLSYDPLGVAADPSMFPLPVQAGSMTENSVVLSVFTDNINKASVLVWRESDPDNTLVYVTDKEIVPREQGLLKVFVEGLAPDTPYHYAFFQLDENGDILSRSLEGHFNTAFPAGCNAPITISGTHGTNFTKYDEFTAVKKSAAYGIDFWVQLGDFSYNDGAVSREQFIEKWFTTLSDNGWLTMLPSTGQYLVWDDHEITDDSTLYWKYLNEPDLIEAGQSVFFDLIPVPEKSSTGISNKYWNSFKWGDTAEIFTLDVRSERIYEFDDKNERSKCLQYIGPEQMNWLKKALSESSAHFKIILNSVPITAMPAVWPMSIDRWDGFPAQREELLGHIVDNGIENVWFLSGDFHTGSVAKITSSGDFSHIREINLGPGGNTFPYPFLGELGEFVIAPQNQFSFFRTYPTVSVVTFDPSDSSVHIEFYNPDSDEQLFSETFY